MGLPTGHRLGPYEILGAVGAGGMGEVYRARDTRLGREVAIKVVSANRAGEPERKMRFFQEARAASALNHPNIVTIYDIAESDGIDFLVMELIPGKSLDRVLTKGGMPPGEALPYAVALADALARAHAAGIVHRDLKPANIIISNDGVLKVLDFGLAKLAEPSVASEAGPTLTMEGTIAGTIAYMSPEQAEGKPVDARSDIFSFGCVVYEMLTGRRAFTGDTQASTLAAVLREEPLPLSQIVTGVPRDLERIVQRCMRKNIARRFQHMDDVKVELEELREDSESVVSTSVQGAASRRPPGWAIWAAAITVILAAAGSMIWLRLRPGTDMSPLVPVPLVTDAGVASAPTFSPDGSQVAYSWDGESQANFDIYVKLIGTAKALRLTTNPDPDRDPAWSPDGRSIAFVRRGAAIYLVSPLGGGERKVAEGLFPVRAGSSSPSAPAWSPDSKLLAIAESNKQTPQSSIYTIRIDDGFQQRLTMPGAAVGDFNPAFSPDGTKLSFVRCRDSSVVCGLYVLNLHSDFGPAGDPQLIGSVGGAFADAKWTADGRELIYLFDPAGVRYHLMRIRTQPGASPQRMTFGGESISSTAISARGNRLAYAVNLTDFDLRLVEPGRPTRSIGSSTRGENNPQFSPDGLHLTFSSDRTGVSEIWTCDPDGANPVQWTHYGDRHSGSPRWSPDGHSIAFDSQTSEGWHVYVMASDSGQPHRLTSEHETEDMPAWSADGKTIYFASNRTGRNEIWSVPSSGGKPSQVTRAGGRMVSESRDGRTLFYTKDSHKAWDSPLWMRAVDGGPEKQLLDEMVVNRAFVVEEDGVYYLTRSSPQDPTSLKFYRFATGRSEVIAGIEDHGVSLGLTVSTDRKHFVYSGSTSVGQNLMLVDGFR